MPLYSLIYILLYFSFILKISYKHSLILFFCLLYYILLIYLLPKVSYISLLITRARGFGLLGRFWGRFRGFGRVLSAYRSFCGLSAGVRGVLRARSCVFFRACARGGMPPPFFARAQSLRVYPLIVYGEYAGEYRVV